LRCFQDEIFDFLSCRLKAIAKEIEEDSGCRMEFTFLEGYPALINGEDIFEDFKKALTANVADYTIFTEFEFASPQRSFTLIEPDQPTMTAEDFSFYQKRLPGLFFYLGTGTDQPLHSDRFNFNESVLPAGVEIYTRLLFLCGQI
jgi:hippurate hydrolase